MQDSDDVEYYDRLSAGDEWEQFCALDAAKQKDIFVSLLSVIEAFNDCSDDLEFYKYAWRMQVGKIPRKWDGAICGLRRASPGSGWAGCGAGLEGAPA